MTPYGFLFFDKHMVRQFSHNHPDTYEQFNMDTQPVYTADQLKQAKVEVLTKTMKNIDPCLMVTQGVLRQMIDELGARK